MQNVAEAILLKKELDSLRPISKADEGRIMDKFRLDWNFHSNNMEGNTLTYGETKALILHNITAQGKPLKDHFEMTGHDEAIKWIMDIVKQKRPLTEIFIRELHKLCLKEPYEVDAITPDGKPTKKMVQVGEYKTTPNHVATKTGEIFRFATPEETPAKMQELIDWYRQKIEKQDVNAILLAAEFHYKYIRIHPFDDGNGRTARILMNFILMQFGFPPVVIKTEDKQNYISALEQADAGILEPFVEYIAGNLIYSLEIMIKGAKGLSIEEPDDIDKEVALLEQKLNAVSETTDKLKTKESILELYDDTILKLIDKLTRKGKLLEKFYSKLNMFLCISGWGKDCLDFEKEAKILIKKKVLDGTSGIQIEFKYKEFRQKGFDKFDFKSQVSFVFHQTASYQVKDSQDKTVYEKRYGQQLTEEEINQVVNAEVRRHKAFIEGKIKDISESDD